MTDLPTPVIPEGHPTKREALFAVARVEAGQSLNQDEATALLASSGESSDRLVVAVRQVHDAGLEAAGRTGVVTYCRKVTQLVVTAEPTLTALAPGIVAPYDPMTRHDGLNAAVGAGRRRAEERRPGSPAVVVPADLQRAAMFRCGDVGGLHATHREESQRVGNYVLEGIPCRVRTA